MKSKGLAVLAVFLIALFLVIVVIDYDNTPLATLLAPAIPNQTYDPTIPTPDQKVVCIVFDDGWKSQLDAIPVLQNYGFKATFAVATSYTSYPAYMDWKDIRCIAAQGMDIASHTDTHIDLSKVSYNTLYGELSKSQATLRARGYPANIFVYPYGGASDNETVREAVAQFYLVARGTTEGQCNLTTCDRYNLQSFDVFHEVSIQNFADYVKGTTGTNVTILYYHKISGGTQDTEVSLATFQAQMQYLHDNGYTTQTLSGLFLKKAPVTQ